MRELWPSLRGLYPLLPQGARRFFTIYVAVTSFLTLLDVAAMAVLAVTISAAANNAQINVPLFGTFDPSVVPTFILIACLLLITKSLLNVVMQFIATRRFAGYEFAIGKRLFDAYMRSSWEERSRRTSAEITRIADLGIANTMMGFVIPLSHVPSSILTFVLILAVLVVAQPLTAAVAVVYLAAIALIVNRLVTRRALEAGEVNRDFSYRVAILMTEVVDALKELTLRARLSQVGEVIAKNRSKSVRARANMSFLGVLPQYSFEAALIGGFLLIGISTYLLMGMASAVAAVALFAAAGFRLVPAIIGVQNSLVSASTTVPYVRDVIEDLARAESSASVRTSEDKSTLATTPKHLALRDVHFAYQGSTAPVIRGLDLDITLGSSLGVVGPSGAGKSTLIDLILGLSSPTSGRISIDGMPLEDVLRAWRRRVGYVPQRVALFDGSIAQNVALTWEDDFDRDKVIEVLEKVKLRTLVEGRDGGVDARIGERGLSLSGGQQQRLGIARALYSDPLVLVLDEATSSLDSETEEEITKAIRDLAGEITLISVAHRISTLKDYDQLCYLDQGKIIGKGTFRSLESSLPQFRLQVKLAGLGVDSALLDAE